MSRTANNGNETQFLDAEGWEFQYKVPGWIVIAKRALKNAVTIGLILGVWFLVSIWVEAAREIDFPTPVETFLRLFELVKGEKLYDYTLYDHYLISLKRWGIAFSFAAIVGVGAGPPGLAICSG